MKAFQFNISQRVIFESGAIKKIPELLNQFNCTKPLLISDRGLERVGTVEKVREIVEEAGMSFAQYLDVMPNPTVECVNTAARACKESASSAIIALGGGSAMDVAKAVGILARYGGDIADYEGSCKVPGPILPVMAIPTTAGTGSEVTSFSVIEDLRLNRKMSICSPEIIPSCALLDPELIMTLPAPVAAATGMDALIHSIEAYLSLQATAFTDAMAEKAMELIGGALRAFVACRQNFDAAQAMLAGSMFAGLAFSSARLGIVHAMSHPLSAYFQIPHGVANSVLLPAALEYNSLADGGRHEKIYSYISGRGRRQAPYDKKMLQQELCELISDLGMPLKLSDLGVDKDKIPAMARDAMTSGNIACNPRQVTLPDIEALYIKCM